MLLKCIECGVRPDKEHTDTVYTCTCPKCMTHTRGYSSIDEAEADWNRMQLKEINEYIKHVTIAQEYSDAFYLDLFSIERNKDLEKHLIIFKELLS